MAGHHFLILQGAAWLNHLRLPQALEKEPKPFSTNLRCLESEGRMEGFAEAPKKHTPGGGLKTHENQTKAVKNFQNAHKNRFQRKAWRFFLYRRAKIMIEKKKLVHLKRGRC